MPDTRMYIQAFGAIGDGKADDTPAFKAAAKLAGEKIYIPWTMGGYRISDSICVKCHFIGTGIDRPTIHLYGESRFILTTVPGSGIQGICTYTHYPK